MTKQVRYLRWTVSVDVEATRAATAREGPPRGGADECDCTGCQNFRAVREGVYSPELRALFQELGLDYRREVEAAHIARMPDGRHAYTVWFHFVGTIDEGVDAAVPTGEYGWTFELERSTDAVSLGFTTRTNLVPASSAGLPVVQIELGAQARWVIAEPEPD